MKTCSRKPLYNTNVSKPLNPTQLYIYLNSLGRSYSLCYTQAIEKMGNGSNDLCLSILGLKIDQDIVATINQALISESGINTSDLILDFNNFCYKGEAWKIILSWNRFFKTLIALEICES